LSCCRVLVRGEDIAQDGGVDATSEVLGTNVGLSPDPVIPDGLIGVEHKRIALASKDLDGVDSQWLDIYTINLNDCLDGIEQSGEKELEVRAHHSMAID